MKTLLHLHVVSPLTDCLCAFVSLLSCANVFLHFLTCRKRYFLLLTASFHMLQRLEEVMQRKNGTIQGLQYDLAKVCKAHNDLIRVYEAKLSDFGIPAEELGFRPLLINTTTGPAGLVVGA